MVVSTCDDVNGYGESYAGGSGIRRADNEDHGGNEFRPRPWSIRYALRQEHETEREDARRRRQIPTDFVAVVLSLDMNVSRGRADFLMSDPSLPDNACVKVEIKGDGHVSRLLSDRIERGDLVRFNRLELRDDPQRRRRRQRKSCEHRAAANTGDTEASLDFQDLNNFVSHQRPTIIAEFRPSWKNPEAGNVFSKINGKNFGRNGGYCDSSALESWFDKLKDWFRKRYLNSSPSSLPSSGVPISKCRKRSLSEINAPHLLSDVLVQVVTVTYDDVDERSSFSRKRRRDATPFACAMLSDGPNVEDVMALHRCSRLRASLDRAAHERANVILTRVVSLTAEDSDDALVLVPTQETTIKMDENGGRWMFAETLAVDSGVEQTKEVRGFPFTPTQATQETLSAPIVSLVIDGDRKVQSENETRSTARVRSRILDIVFNGTDKSILSSDAKASPQRFVDIMFETSRSANDEGLPTPRTSSTRNTQVPLRNFDSAALCGRRRRKWLLSLRLLVTKVCSSVRVRTHNANALWKLATLLSEKDRY